MAFLLGGLCAAPPLPADLSPETEQRLEFQGIPRAETYYSRDTGVRGDIHDFFMLPNGELAVLTTVGCFSFDGTHWERIPGPAWATRGLILPEERQAVVAHRDGLARLSPDGVGGYAVESLTPPEAYPPNLPALENVTRARGCFFGLAGQNLVVVSPDATLAHYRLPNWATACFAIGDEVYFTGGLETLLNRWDWEQKRLVDSSSVLDSAGVYEWMIGAFPRQEGGVWLLTASNKILAFDGESTSLWPGMETLASFDVRVTDLAEPSPGTLAIGTSSKGLLVIDPSGKALLQYSREHGLNDVNVHQVGTDPQSGIWIATEHSLTRIPSRSLSLLYNENHGLAEDILSIAFFRGRMYLGTSYGLYADNPEAKGMDETFVRVYEQNDIEDLLVVGDTLFIAGSTLLVMDASGEIETLDANGTRSFFQPSQFPGVVLAGDFRGVSRYEKRQGEWTRIGRLPGREQDYFSFAEDRRGNLFGGLGNAEIARIYLDGPVGRVENLALPQPTNGNWTSPVNIEGEVYVNTAPVVRWDHEAEAFVADPEMYYYPGAPPYGFEHVYGRSPEAAYVARNARSGITMPRPSAQIVGDISSVGYSIDNRALCLAYDGNGYVWAGGRFGLIRAIAAPESRAPGEIKPRINRILLSGDKTPLPAFRPASDPLVLQPSQNSLAVSVEFPNFHFTNHHLFQIYLEGHDQDWGEFSEQAKRELSNLDPGRYTLKVNALDATGQFYSAEDYAFTILSPWYVKPWAFALYVLAALLLVGAIVRFYIRAQVRKSRELERLVRERTREIESKNNELEQQAQILALQNDELEEKTEELQNTTASLTETLSRLHHMQDQLVATARTAGKAEIATNVLHNVGNVLNSINISLTVLSQKVEASNVSKLARLADLVANRLDDIDAYLTTDPKGKLIPKYLIQISKSLQDECAALAYEIDTMEQDVDHVKRIIAAQQSHAKNQNVAQDFNLRELCETALTILGKDRSRTQLEILNEIPPDLRLHNDKHRLLEIVLNLVSNAQDSIQEQSPEIGAIRLQAEVDRESERVAIRITDNGVGIASDHAKKLFNHGFTTKESGHGFGLHSAANAATVLGGNLSLSSLGLGKGATATIDLPLAYSTSEAALN